MVGVLSFIVMALATLNGILFTFCPDVHRGTGLSLAISSTMVSEYDGRIEVQSARGSGSTFRVVMPRAT